MIRALTKRLLGTLSVLLGVSFVVFLLGSLMPGDLATVIFGEHGGSASEYEAMREQLGLNKNVFLRYLDWLWLLLQGDMGMSPVTGRSVTSVINQAAPLSFQIAFVSMVVATLIGVPVGIYQAAKANSRVDSGLRILMLLNVSIPNFFLGVVLLLLTARWLPQWYVVDFVPLREGLLPSMRSIMLPVVGVSLTSAAMISQMTRTRMIRALGDPSIQTAKAMGESQFSIRYFHGLRNALPPVITLIGYDFGSLLGALVVVEEVFALPGLGRELLIGISTRDFPLIVGITLVFAATFVIINMVVDIVCIFLDPRQRSGA